MSALSEASTPAQEAGAASIDTQQLQQLGHNGDPSQQPGQNGQSISGGETGRKRMSSWNCTYVAEVFIDSFAAKAPSVRRACVACHTGKTRCSEVLPCQVCRF